jgi:hypothetical protein
MAIALIGLETFYGTQSASAAIYQGWNYAIDFFSEDFDEDFNED